MKLLEKDIQRQILEYLAYQPDIYAWRNNAGMILKEHKGKTRAINLGEAGLPDILGVIAPEGRLLGIEVKRPGREPTKLQQGKIEELRQRGALVFVATSVEDVIEHLEGD